MEIIFYTGRGLPPFLSSHTLQSVHLSFAHFYNSRNLFKSITLPEYSSLTASSTYLSLRDTMNLSYTIKGHTDYSLLKIPVPQNTDIKLEKYMEFANEAKTTYVASFAEEASLSSGGKKAERSAKNAVKALNASLNMQRHFKLLGNIQGGGDVDLRVWCTKEMRKKNVDGLIIGGLDLNDFGLFARDLLKNVTSELQGYDKMVVLSGPGRMVDVVYAATLGITHCESCWPFKLALEGKALAFDLTKFEVFEESIEDQEFCEEEINLNLPQFRFQQGPLLSGCECLACKEHHRGYIYHLLQVKEMTATTLLAIHNTHVYQQIPKFIEKFKNEGKLQFAYATFVKNFCGTSLKDL